jgi:hypothetical protein
VEPPQNEETVPQKDISTKLTADNEQKAIVNAAIRLDGIVFRPTMVDQQ